MFKLISGATIGLAMRLIVLPMLNAQLLPQSSPEGGRTIQRPASTETIKPGERSLGIQFCSL